MSKFKDHVTSTAFSLTLSRPMIEALSVLDQYGKMWCTLPTYRALYDRGLVEKDETITRDLPEELLRETSPTIKLTDAGKSIIPLLKLCDLYVVMAPRVEGAFITMPVVKLKEEYQKQH